MSSKIIEKKKKGVPRRHTLNQTSLSSGLRAVGYPTSYFLRGQTPHLRDLPGHTHIHRAAVTPHANGRKMPLRLLTAHAPINQRDKNHETALHIATRHGNLDEV